MTEKEWEAEWQRRLAERTQEKHNALDGEDIRALYWEWVRDRNADRRAA